VFSLYRKVAMEARSAAAIAGKRAQRQASASNAENLCALTV